MMADDPLFSERVEKAIKKEKMKRRNNIRGMLQLLNTRVPEGWAILKIMEGEFLTRTPSHVTATRKKRRVR